MNLTQFLSDGVEILVNTKTGESFASVSGYARMSGKAQSTISGRIGKHPVNEAQIQTTTGFKTVRLISEDLIAQWMPKDNPAIATQFMKLGVRMFLHELAGFEYKIDIPQTYSQALFEAARLAQENERLQQEIENNAPLVKFAQAIQFSDGSVDFSAYAKMIGTGEIRLLRQMRECGVIIPKTTLPYQKFIEAGYFEVSQEIRGDKIIPFALVTGKGQLWLKQRLDKYKETIETSVAAIGGGVMSMFGF